MLILAIVLYALIGFAGGIVCYDNDASAWEVVLWAFLWPAVLFLIGIMIIWEWAGSLRRT